MTSSETEGAPVGLVASDDGPTRLSLGVAARLSRYLQVLTQAQKMGREKRGVGYNVDALADEIREILQTGSQQNIALFGAGHLGKAIGSSDIFADHGFNVVAVFDADPKKVGTKVGGQSVRPIEDANRVIAEEDVLVAVLAVPGEAAQRLADELVAAGVRIIFNYSESLLDVPAEVTVHTSNPAVDLLHALYFYLS